MTLESTLNLSIKQTNAICLQIRLRKKKRELEYKILNQSVFCVFLHIMHGNERPDFDCMHISHATTALPVGDLE
jgi:hypothetical protein